MRTVEIMVYQFRELSENAKEKVLKKFREINVENGTWYESTIDFWKEKLAEHGFNDAKIYFSGFWSQGDGACFNADIDAYKAAKSLKFNEMELRIIKLCNPYYKIETIDHHYVHSNTRSVSFEGYYNGPDDWDEFEKIINTPVNELPLLIGSFKEEFSKQLIEERIKSGLEVHANLLMYLEKSLEDVRYKLSNEIYRDLEKDYNYLISDKAVIDTIEINNLKFDKEGNIIRFNKK